MIGRADYTRSSYCLGLRRTTQDGEGLLPPKLKFGPYWWRFGCSPLAHREIHWDAAKTHYELHSDWPIHQEAAGGGTILSGRWLGLRQNFLITTNHLNSLRWVPQDVPPGAAGTGREENTPEPGWEATSSCKAHAAPSLTNLSMVPPGRRQMSPGSRSSITSDHERWFGSWKAINWQLGHPIFLGVISTSAV